MRAATLYQGPIPPALRALKYARERELGPLLARYLVATFAQSPWPDLRGDIDAVVPVPLHPARLSQRGYNQAELLAAPLAHRAGLAHRPTWLERTVETRSQVGLTVAERRDNVANAFAADPAVAGGSILLVDDVFTTGATLSACAACLSRAGARAVRALVLSTPQLAGKPPT